MNTSTTFTLVAFLIMLYYLKSYYDKYISTSALVESFLKEIDLLNKELTSCTAKTVSFDLKLATLEHQVNKHKIEAETLRHEVVHQEENFRLTKEVLEKDFSARMKQENKKAREDSVTRSRAVLRGQASEHLAPFVIKDTNPKDYRFMGNPIDYVCFEGLSDVLDGISDEITSVHFIDIKTGKSSLSKSQRRIRDAVNESRIQFSVINLDKELEEQNDQTKKGSKINNTTKS